MPKVEKTLAAVLGEDNRFVGATITGLCGGAWCLYGSLVDGVFDKRGSGKISRAKKSLKLCEGIREPYLDVFGVFEKPPTEETKMTELPQTQKILISMLKENTGAHFLDSGGAYGRNHERNQEIDFPNTREAWWNWEGELSGTKSLFHWLSEILEYDEEGDEEFQEWAMSDLREDLNWHELRELWMEEMSSRGAGGIYGDGDPFTTNSYNSEEAISQTILFGYYELEGEAFVLLQIHGGCDARGGYTRPRLFQLVEEVAIFDFARLGCFCYECEEGWHTDNGGYHWYANNGGIDLNALEVVVLEEGEVADAPTVEELREEQRKQITMFGEDPEILPTKIYQRKDNGVLQTFCPYCGETLHIGMY